MEVHNISIDDNEADTSNEEMEDEDYKLFMEHENFCQGPTNQSSSNKKLREQFKEWERPNVPDTMFYTSSVLQEQPDAFHFFLLDAVSTLASVKHPGIKLDQSIQSFPLHNVIRLFGVTTLPNTNSQLDHDGFIDFDSQDFSNYDKTNSVSVCCNVHGFLSYFYILPIICSLDDVDEEVYWMSSEQEDFKRFLNDKMKQKILQDITYVEYHDFVEETGQCIARIEVVKYSETDGIYNFFESKNRREGGGTLFLKVYCTLPRFIWTAYSILSEPELFFKNWKFECYEANINNNIRFLTDRNITGCSWYELKGQNYFLRNKSETPVTESHCQIEIDVHFENIVPLQEDHLRYDFNPAVRVLSFDIEVLVSPGDKFPADGNKQVIQIGAVVGNYYSGAISKDEVIGKVIFTLGTCDEIDDAKVVQCYVQQNPNQTDEKYMEDAEAVLLGIWRDFVIQMDPDIISGYNINKFDLPYLLDRSTILSNFQHKAASVFPFIGRMKKMKYQIRVIQNDLKKIHQYDQNNINVNGRLILDFYPIIYRHEKVKRGDSKLKSVAKRYLRKEEEKHDLDAYQEIEGLQHGTSTTRNKMARYCLQDAQIPFLLLFEAVPGRSESFLELYFRKSKMGGVILRYLFNKSMAYAEYFKQIRLQKNASRVVYVPETPSPIKPLGTSSPNVQHLVSENTLTEEASTSKKIIRKLFT